MNLSSQDPFASKASQLLSWGHWFTFANIGLLLLISISYLVADSAPTTLLGFVYMLVTWLSHTSFIAFIAFVLTIFPLSLVFPYPRHIRGMAAVIATLGASMMTLDAYVYFNLGYHLNFSALSEIISLLWQTLNASPAMTSFFAGAMVLLILAFQLTVSNYTWHHLARLKQYKFGRYAGSVILLCFISSHSIHIWADAKLNFDITKQDNVLPLSYPTTAKSLLAKNDLLDLERYKKARDLSVSSADVLYQAPAPLLACQPDAQPRVDIFVFAAQSELESFVSAKGLVSKTTLLLVNNHDDNLFNLVYGLPAYYKPALLPVQQAPIWSDALEGVSVEGFEQFAYLGKDKPLRILAANKDSQVRTDAQKIFAFVLPEAGNDPVSVSKLYSNDTKIHANTALMQPADILATVLAQYWQCPDLAKQTLLGKNLYKGDIDSGLNYSDGVFISYKKDRITLVHADGSYKNLSAAQGFSVDQKLDMPFLIQSLKKLKSFTPR